VLERVRFLFFLFFVFNAAVSAYFLLRGPRQDITQLIASYSLTYLVIYGARGYWKGELRPWMDLLAAGALVGAGLEIDNTIRLYLLFYGVLLYRSLYGGAWGVAAVTGLFLAPLVGATAVTSHGDPLRVSQVLVNVPGFAATAWLMHQVKATLRDYIEALRRETVLTRSGEELVTAENVESVYAAGVKGAMGIVAGILGATAGLAMGTPRTQRQVASGPPLTMLDEPEIKVATLPGPLQTALLELRPIRLAVENAVMWSGREPGQEPAPYTGWVAVVPLAIEGKLRGFISVRARSGLPQGIEDALARLGASLALAMERVTLAEDLRRSTDSLKSSEARFRSLVQNSSDVITLLDEEGRISYISPAVEKLLGYESGELLETRLFQILHPEDLGAAGDLFEQLLRRHEGQELLGTRWRHHDGSYRFMETVLSNQLADPDVSAVVLNTRDVTERKNLEDRLRYEATHDPLSGLGNRVLFKDRVAHSLAAIRGTRNRLAVLFLDLDDFKHVNDSLGHAAGDGLLLAVAGRLHDCVGPTDTVARFGGDEFAVLLNNIDDDAYPIAIAERILASFRQPLNTNHVEMIAAFSIGIAVSTPEASDPEELLRNADTAMYRAKSRGKRTYDVFETSMHAAAIERLEMEYDLRQAIERDELFLRYQPIVWLDSEQISGVEALVRWMHPEKGLIMPDRFIPMAEETGLINQLGAWVMERACNDVRSWELAFPDHKLKLGVNLSVRQLQRADIAAEIRGILKKTGLSPDRLNIEITESAVMREGEETAAVLQKIRSVGIKVAIDDFGTGYSSLSYLTRFPIDIIKIDRAFVKQSSRSAKNTALLRAIVGLGHSLGVDIVVEGIETRQQAKILEPLGCRGQGYYFSKGFSNEEMLRVLATGLRGESAKPKRRAAAATGESKLHPRPVLELIDGTAQTGS